MADETFTPTHAVPAGGLPAWGSPDPSTEPVARLDPGLEVEVDGAYGAWAHVVCSNTWSAWVDGRRLEALAVPAAVTPSSSQTSSPPQYTPPYATAQPAGAGPGAAAGTASGVGPAGDADWAGTGQAGAGQAGAGRMTPGPMAAGQAGVSQAGLPSLSQYGTRTLLGLIGGAGVAVSGLMPWIGSSAGGSAGAMDIPLVAVFLDRVSPQDPSLGLTFLILGVLGIVAMIAPRVPGWASKGAALAVVVTTAMFVKQTVDALNLAGGQGPSLLSTLGLGVFVAAVASVLLLLGQPSGES